VRTARILPTGLLVLGLAAVAAAQTPGGPLETPGERREEIPIPGAPPPEALSPAPEALPQTALPELRAPVREIRIRGNTVVDDAALREVARPYVGRELTTADIEALREALTRLYVARGYLTSGAIVPDQDLAEGVLEIRVVEGRVAELQITGNERFRTAWLRQRILPDPDAPLEVPDLEARLRRLQDDPDIRAVHAELRPGVALGESMLRVRIEEGVPWRLAFDVDDYRSPVIGEINSRVRAGMRNLVGWGDLAEVAGQFGEGLRDVEARYAALVSPWDTRLAVRFRWSESEVVEQPFDALDVESDYWTAGLELSQPLLRTDGHEVRMGVLAEWRLARSWVLGEGFSFSEGADRGETQIVPLRPFVEWVHRGRAQVMALRGQLSVGLDVPGATDVSGRLEDATFVSGLVQAQWARRFDALLGTEVVARGDLQLAADPLFSIEQFSLGGHASVRGYRENQLVRDNGAALSLEVRVPVWRRPDGTSVLQVAPFVDYGRGWDHHDRAISPADTLASVGVGLRWRPLAWLAADLYWGYPLEDVPDPPEDDALQDQGLHFQVRATAF
jgi:hemolysin activation/secretion protein